MKQAAAERELLIDELARSQRVLLRRNEELEALDAEKARWLGMATHDLRNPLGAILANCELLVDEPSIPAKHRATIGAIHSSGEFMLQLLNDVLDISAMDSGGQRLRLEPTDLHLLVEESIAVTAPLARRKGTQVEAIFEKSMPVVVTVDRHNMMQLFQNLIGNAVKFSQSGAKVEVAVATEGRRILISVKDNGPGIPDGQLESIFRPFHRSTDAAEPGTGLGLAICKRIVERHGGWIRAENRAGGGAVFLVSLDRDFLEAMSA